MNEYSGESTMAEYKEGYCEIPCQNCGAPVIVHLPFFGCVFCSACSGGRAVAYMMKEINHADK